MHYKAVLRLRSPMLALATSTVIAAAVALAGCTSDGTPDLTTYANSVGSFVSNLFGSKSEDQPQVAHNAAAVEPSAPKPNSATPQPKHSAVAAAAPAHPAKPHSQPAKTKTATKVPKPSPKQQASAESQSPQESATSPSLSGAAPVLAPGSFDNRVESRR